MTTVIARREAIRRVTVLLGGAAFIGGDTLLSACARERPAAAETIGDFSTADIAFLDEVAETILPETSTPGAKAARTGAFIALMVTDTYDPADQQVFREGMRRLDDASRSMNGVAFMEATPQQRLSLLESLDQEQKRYMESRAAARSRASREETKAEPPAETTEEKEPESVLPDQRKEGALGTDVGAAAAITADAPPHYFRMVKELTLLGYFTSEIGCNQAQRYIESPGRFDPCVPYQPGERAWAAHA
jgi:hypothetical protein